MESDLLKRIEELGKSIEETHRQIVEFKKQYNIDHNIPQWKQDWYNNRYSAKPIRLTLVTEIPNLPKELVSLSVGKYSSEIDVKTEVLKAIYILSNYIGYDVQIVTKP